jgi:hypothetical protein
MDQITNKDDQYCENLISPDEFLEPILQKIQKLQNHPKLKQSVRERLLGHLLERLVKSRLQDDLKGK